MKTRPEEQRLEALHALEPTAERAVQNATVHRFKVSIGDREPEVIGECFSGLLAIAAEENLLFVAGHMADRNDGIRDVAALALGESRHPLALEQLQSAWVAEVLNTEFRSVLIRAAALHRSEPAFDWLIHIIEKGIQKQADEAADALAVYERNARLMERIQVALASRADNDSR